jgi:hypothetical protein
MIYLEDFERNYLLHLITGVTYNDKFPIEVPAKTILSKIKMDISRLQEIGECRHTPGKYKGIKTCCTKCGSLYEVGMEESWELID